MMFSAEFGISKVLSSRSSAFVEKLSQSALFEIYRLYSGDP
jgi:hypothetical protein